MRRLPLHHDAAPDDPNNGTTRSVGLAQRARGNGDRGAVEAGVTSNSTRFTGDSACEHPGPYEGVRDRRAEAGLENRTEAFDRFSQILLRICERYSNVSITEFTERRSCQQRNAGFVHGFLGELFRAKTSSTDVRECVEGAFWR